MTTTIPIYFFLNTVAWDFFMKEVDKVSFFNRRDFSTLGTYTLSATLSRR